MKKKKKRQGRKTWQFSLSNPSLNLKNWKSNNEHLKEGKWVILKFFNRIFYVLLSIFI